jgi:hypothetical protein
VKCFVILVIVSGCGAQKIKVEPVKVEPIHMTIDVNLHDANAPRPAKP